MKKKQKKIVYEFICEDFYVPMKFKELAVMFQLPKNQRDELRAILEELINEGKVRVTAKGKYVKGEANRLQGTFIAHERGFGFVKIEGRDEDIFIPGENVQGAFEGDLVEVVLVSGTTEESKTGRRAEGKVVHIISRGTVQIVGYYEKSKKYGFVRPDNQKLGKDIFIPLERSKGAVTGHKVVVELTSYGGEKKKPEGKVVEIIGHVNDPGVDILSIVKDCHLPTEFPKKVLNQAERVGTVVSEADCEGRLDLRDVVMVTIDGEDAKDLDDAVSLTVRDGLYHLGVHIADVTNYVQENSALDWEALKRGTSVYLVDRVIPMLPHALSNGICSLNAGEDRLSLSCMMTIDEGGNVIDHQLAETVIHVNERMTYTAVKNIIQGKMKEGLTAVAGDVITGEEEEVMTRYHDLVPMFMEMKQLADILREKRHKRGAIDFDFPETKMVLDESGKPIDVKAYDRNCATKIIEDFMLLANETVAEHYFWNETPFVYRIHETPDEEKIQKLATFIQNFGHTMHFGQEKIHPKELQKLLQKVQGMGEADLISRIMLRSMKQAKYTSENAGHFGLATKYYTHFTSPIRRYPDLQIHRIIKEDLRGKLSEERKNHYESILGNVTRDCSELERRAEQAERETIKLKKAEYMQNYIGEEFHGIISSITNWGMYVELTNSIEGLIHVTSMNDDHYEYYEARYEMVGRNLGKVYKLGQEIDVRVIGVDKLQRTIDFEEAVRKGCYYNETIGREINRK